jgi:hypothetical protein
MYQLVLQFPAVAVDFDELIAIEEALLAVVAPPATVDGHDFGSGEGNIFILTGTPVATLDIVLPVLERLSVDGDTTVAYRVLESSDFTVIWPKCSKGEFSVA